MKLRSWFSTCYSAGSVHSSPPSSSSSTHYLSDSTASSSSSVRMQTQSSFSSADDSLQSCVSLLTLPSVPSLQHTFLPLQKYSDPAAAAVLVSSVKPTCRPDNINFLVLHDKLLYSASGYQIHVFEASTNTLFDVFNAENASSGAVKSIAFSEGKIFTAHQDCKLRVWRLNLLRKQHKLIATLPTMEDRLRRFILPHNYINVRRHKKRLWINHHDAVSGLETYENLVISISWDRSLKIWHARNYQCLESINAAHNDAINAIAVSKQGLIYTGSADKRINVWGKATGEKKHGLIATLEKHKSAVNALALSPDGSTLFSGSCDRSILVWEREDSANHMAVTGALRGHGKAILCLINVRDLLLSGSADRTVRIWRRGYDGKYVCLTVLDGHRSPVRSVSAVRNDGGENCTSLKVFSGSFDGELKEWDVQVSNM